MRIVALLALAFITELILLCDVISRRDPKHRLVHALGWTHWWCRWSARLAGIRLTVDGPQPPRGALLAPNHLGYGDIWAMGAATRCFFMPKAELQDWPFVKWLVGHSQQVFVSRQQSDRGLVGVVERLRERLSDGDTLCVFLEGTSTAGDKVLPFMPSLVQPVIDTRAVIVPVAIRWQCENPRVNIGEEIAYWRPEHTFGPHLWRFVGFRGVQCHVTFGTPIKPEGLNRKQLAAKTRERVVEMLGV